MKRSRYTEEQMIGILKDQETGTPVAELFLHLEEQVRRLEISEAKRLRAMETENAQLKRLLADAMLDNAALKDAI
jgi:putative transposase